MTEYNGNINNLLQGVSQQARLERRPEQLESQVNCYSSVTKGLGNRPGTQILTHGSTTAYPSDAAYYVYDRGDTLERYSMVVTSGAIKVTDLLTGTDRTVDLDGLTAYLTSSDPDEDFRFHTIADTTFILNRDITPTMSGATASADIWQAIIYAKKASWGFDYKVYSDDQLIAHCSTPASVTITATTQDKMITLKTTDIISCLWAYEDVGNANTPKVDISSISRANPAVVQLAAHNFEVGDDVIIRDDSTMVEILDTAYEVIAVSPTTITLDVNSSGFTVSTGDGTVDLASVVGIEAWATAQGVTASTFEDVIYLSDTSDWSIEIEDANHGNDLVTFGQTIDLYENLPRVCYDGYKVKVGGIDPTIYNDYYVTFEAENGSGIGHGVWKETAGFGVDTEFDPETMPHILTREADGSFLFREVPWVDRDAGDDNTNPQPSFVGDALTDKEISDIMTYQGRLVLVSEENVVASVTFDHYNFFADTVTTEADNDPIDTASSDNQVTNLHHGLVFNASLVLFSDRAQFIHSADTAFTTNNFGLSSKARYKNLVGCQPVASASSIFFPYQAGQFTGIREIQVDNLTGNVVAEDTSAQVDHYIPGLAKQLESSSDYNILIVRPDNDPTALYVFQWFNQEGKRKQAAWHKWEFGNTIQHIAIVQDKLYLWKQIGTVVSVEYIDLSDTDTTGVEFPVRLDHQDVVTATDDGDDWKIDVTQWVTTRSIDRDDLRVVAGDDTGIEGAIAEYYDHATDANAFRVPKISVTSVGTPDFIVGGVIEAEGQITNPYVRSNDGKPKTKGTLRINHMKFNCSDTGALDIIVEKNNSPTYTKEFNTRLIDSDDFVLDEPPELLDIGIKAAVRSNADRCSIKFYSDNHLPFYISDIDWAGSYYETGRRTI